MRKLLRILVPALVLSLGACSKGPGDSEDAVPSTSEGVLSAITDLETKLKDYGVSFSTSQTLDSQNTSYYTKNYHLEVRLLQNGTSEDFKAAGLKEADLAALFEKMSNLYDAASKQGFGYSDDVEKRFALMKIQLVRNKVMIPRAVKAGEHAMKLADAPLFKFKNISVAGFSVWDSAEITAEQKTNAEVLAFFDEVKKAHKEFAALKPFIDEYVAHLDKLARKYQGNRDSESQLNLVQIQVANQTAKAMQELVLLSPNQEQLVNLLIVSLRNQNSNEKFSVRLMDSINESLVPAAITERAKRAQALVTEAMAYLGVSWQKNAQGHIEMNSTQLAQAKIRMDDYSYYVNSKKSGIKQALAEVDALVEKLGNLAVGAELNDPAWEAKIQLFLAL